MLVKHGLRIQGRGKRLLQQVKIKAFNCKSDNLCTVYLTCRWILNYGTKTLVILANCFCHHGF